MKNKILFVILDGVADHKIKELGSKTPLEAAKKPNIDKVCKYSECGMIYPIDIGIVPGSDTAHLSLFGYDPYKEHAGRGVYEALGIGLDLKPGDIAFRVNFATTDGKNILDRRAGRNGKYIDELIEDFLEHLDIPYEVILKKTVEHRGVLIIKGRGELSKDVIGNDIHREGSIIDVKPKTNDEKSVKTAELLNYIIKKFHEFSEKHIVNEKRKREGLKPANYLLIRGAGEIRKVQKFEDRYKLKACFIAGAPMYKGVAKYVGMFVPEVPGATGTVNTSLVSKAEKAIECKSKYDIIFIHVKATDTLAHDKKPKEKKKFIELVDQRLFYRLKDEFDIIVLTGDHTTSSIFGTHTADPVPIMIYSNIADRKDSVKNFTERKCYRGILGTFKGIHIMKVILNKLDMLEVFE